MEQQRRAEQSRLYHGVVSIRRLALLAVAHHDVRAIADAQITVMALMNLLTWPMVGGRPDLEGATLIVSLGSGWSTYWDHVADAVGRQFEALAGLLARERDVDAVERGDLRHLGVGEGARDADQHQRPPAVTGRDRHR